MATGATQPPVVFDPTAYGTFRFVSRTLGRDGVATLRYALDELQFAETVRFPLAAPLTAQQAGALDGLLALLHWVAGVSYYKTALPPAVAFEGERPGPAAGALLEALYSQGLGELAYVNRLEALPRPRFPSAATAAPAPAAPVDPASVLVPVGGGKDSVVAIEAVRRAGVEQTLFSVGDAAPIARTAAVAALPRLVARRELDPLLFSLNEAGAINGHVPVTAIVTCVATLTAALHGIDAVAMANERSASAGNVSWDGVEVNHQFSKSLECERLLSAALAESGAAVRQFSLLRPASELAIARAFARLERYHGAFTSCNATFRLDPAQRASSWCRDCPKCRFVFLALAPFSEPSHLERVFGADLLADEAQYAGFALLAASGGHKPFECVGEEQETIAAIRLLAEDPRWSAHAVVRRLAAEVLPGHPLPEGDPRRALALADEHDVPPRLLDGVRALLGA